MCPASSLSRCGVLLIAIVCPLLLGSYAKCVAVSNPTLATARIDQIEPESPRVGETVQTSGRGDGTPPLQFTWDFGDGVLVGGMQATHTYREAGNYRVTLTVRDAMGNVATDSADVVVAARSSSSIITAVQVSKAVAQQPVVFAAFPLDESVRALNYEWKFNDGQIVAGPWTVATFSIAGTYVASITVTDDLGAIANTQITFQVEEAAH